MANTLSKKYEGNVKGILDVHSKKKTESPSRMSAVLSFSQNRIAYHADGSILCPWLIKRSHKNSYFFH